MFFFKGSNRIRCDERGLVARPANHRPMGSYEGILCYRVIEGQGVESENVELSAKVILMAVPAILIDNGVVKPAILAELFGDRDVAFQASIVIRALLPQLMAIRTPGYAFQVGVDAG